MVNKIAVGQCYEKDDIIYEVLNRLGHTYYFMVQEIITKDKYLINETTLLSMRRPFQNFG